VAEAGLMDPMWLNNPSEAQVSVIPVPHDFDLTHQGKSKVSLHFGVFKTVNNCPWKYDQSTFCWTCNPS
jgi:hypothetical protein